jgi:hypothetical protein
MNVTTITSATMFQKDVQLTRVNFSQMDFCFFCFGVDQPGDCVTVQLMPPVQVSVGNGTDCAVYSVQRDLDHGIKRPGNILLL